MLDFSRLIVEYLEARRAEEHKPRKIGVYYASELGSECLRQSYFRYTVEKPLESFTLGVFTIGDLLHDWFEESIKEILEEQGHKVEIEKEVPPYKYDLFEIHGRADLYIDDSFVVDIKTVSPNTFKYQLPKQPHIAQVNFYIHQLEAEKGAIIYLDKYALRIRNYEVAFDIQLFDSSIKLVRHLHEHLIHRVIPERCESYPDKYPCTYCNYREECEEAN